jgi:hypothetical protein
MKKIFNYAILLVLLISFPRCAEDYLDTAPTSSTGAATIFENTDNAAGAVNGLARFMTRQYGSSSSIYGQGYNGEGTVKMYYGNYQGTAFVYPATGWTATVTGNNHDVPSSSYTAYPWYYYYQIVSNANSILANIDGAKGPDSEKQRIKAQALTYRAYAFTMLVQLYGYRWIDSNNGATLGIILRLDPTLDPMPRSTMAETYQQIYDDLDDAIRLYGDSKWKRATDDVWTPNVNVAYAVYARAAINKLDYPKAIEMSVKAREGFPLMTKAEYLSGFCKPNREWIWGSYASEDETLYFYSYHAYIAYNSTAGAVKSTPKCISKDYYVQIPGTDIRKNLFLDAGTYAGSNTTTGEAANTTDIAKYARATYPDLQSDAKIFAYMQFKVKNFAQAGVGFLNHFRSSEMYLIEAEAQYKTGNEQRARQLLLELTKDSGRDPEFTCTETGETLFTKLKLVAQIELWGEGFDWFMVKRWNDHVIHRSFAKGGNYVSAYDADVAPNEKNKQTWMIPLKETDYNPLAKQQQ